VAEAAGGMFGKVAGSEEKVLLHIHNAFERGSS
jgi:hypothetical protein